MCCGDPKESVKQVQHIAEQQPDQPVRLLTRRNFIKKTTQAAALSAGVLGLMAMPWGTGSAQTSGASLLEQMTMHHDISSFVHLLGQDRVDLLAEALQQVTPLRQYFEETQGYRIFDHEGTAVRIVNAKSTYDAMIWPMHTPQGVTAGRKVDAILGVGFNRGADGSTTPVVNGIIIESNYDVAIGDEVVCAVASLDVATGDIVSYGFTLTLGSGFEGFPQELRDQFGLDELVGSPAPITLRSYSAASSSSVGCTLCQIVWDSLEAIGCFLTGLTVAILCEGAAALCAGVVAVLCKLATSFGGSAETACKNYGFC